MNDKQLELNKALSEALQHQHFDIAEYLLKKGASPNSKRWNNELEPLLEYYAHRYAFGSDSSPSYMSVELLLKHGADMNRKSLYGYRKDLMNIKPGTSNKRTIKEWLYEWANRTYLAPGVTEFYKKMKEIFKKYE